MRSSASIFHPLMAPAVLLATVGFSLNAAAQSTYFVAPCGDDSWSGLNIECQAPNGPKSTIQAAIDVSVSGDTVLMEDGTYVGPGNVNVDFGGRLITVHSASGSPEDCVIDCQGAFETRAFLFQSGETNLAVVKGLTIANGSYAVGGGMYVTGSSPTVSNCIFSNNGAPLGGGLAVENGSPLVSACVFVANSGRNGAGMSIVNSSPLVTNCEFTGNSATNFFLAIPRGAGVYIPSGSAVLVNCLVAQNTCSGGENFGGGIYNDADLTLVNCTVTANTAENGDGIANFNQLTARNCIVWGNGTEDLLTGGGSIEVITYSAVNAAGAGNILTDPLLLSNFHLQSISPCIDAGSNARVSPDALDLDCDGNTTEPVPIDADGNTRFFDDPNTLDSGAGTPPLVDMGAYEFGASVPPSLRGDMNCDCVTNLNDLPLFVEAMLDPLGLIGCYPSRADMNGDGSGNGEDVHPFFQALLT